MLFIVLADCYETYPESLGLWCKDIGMLWREVSYEEGKKRCNEDDSCVAYQISG